MSKPANTTNTSSPALVPALRFPEFRNAGEWKSDKLGVKCDLYQPETLSSSDLNQSGPYDVYGANGIIGKHDAYNHEDSEVTVTCRGATCGEVHRTNPKSWITGNAMVVKPRDSDLSKDFIFSFLKFTNLKSIISGSAQPQITRVGFAPLVISYPGDTDEQARIVGCLSSLDELIAAQASKVEALKAHKKGLMQQLFPAEGQTIPALRFPEFRNAPGWEQKPLYKICDVLQGYGFPEVLQGKREGKYPFCKVSDISKAVSENGGLLSLAANYVNDDELTALRAKLIPVGATVFAKIGEALRLNRRAFVRKECLIDNNAVGLKAISGVANDYFVYLLSQQIDLNSHCGGAVPSVNKTTLETIPVTVPHDPDEQERIADCLSSLDELIAAQASKVEALKAHKKGLMQQLFPSVLEDAA